MFGNIHITRFRSCKFAFLYLKKGKITFCWYSWNEHVSLSPYIKILVFVYCRRICEHLCGLYMSVFHGACGTLLWETDVNICQSSSYSACLILVHFCFNKLKFCKISCRKKNRYFICNRPERDHINLYKVILEN